MPNRRALLHSAPMSKSSSCLLFITALAGCVPRPLSLAVGDVAARLVPHFDEVFPESPREATGILQPRFGVPAIVAGDQTFPVRLLERGGAQAIIAALVRRDATFEEVQQCVRSQARDCIPLALSEQPLVRFDDQHVLRTFDAQPRGAVSLRGYDLVVATRAGGIVRARSAVFFRVKATGAPLTVIQLSDLHLGRVGQQDRVAERAEHAVALVNARHPDAVVITGDLADQGHSPALELAAANALMHIDAPVLVMLGNHDHGHWPQVLHTDRADAGYFNFARAFHPLLFSTTTIEGWDFVGFDTGPSIVSLRVLTRGISPETQLALKDAVANAAQHERNIVLFSHAPTRGAYSDKPTNLGSHRLGSMWMGAEAVEQLLMSAAQNGQQALHLSGHTHWSDLFVSDAAHRAFTRVPWGALRCPVELTTKAALVNAPSATRISFPMLRHGNGFGMVVLHLSKDSSTAQFELTDKKGQPVSCAP